MSPMWVLVGLWLLLALAGIDLLRKAVKTSAGFMALALYGVLHYRLQHLPMVAFAITRDRRIKNAVAAVIYPIGVTVIVVRGLIFVAGLLAQLSVK